MMNGMMRMITMTRMILLQESLHLLVPVHQPDQVQVLSSGPSSGPSAGPSSGPSAGPSAGPSSGPTSAPEEVVEDEPEQEEDDGIVVDDDGVEWYEDGEGVNWYRMPGETDWQEWQG